MRGLTTREAVDLQNKYGKNSLPEKPIPAKLAVFFSQFKNPLVYVLLAAGTITAIMGDLSDTLIISIAVFINTLLGFVQEDKANNALYALKKLLNPVAKVYREGKVSEINTQEIVPGDVVILDSGTKIPADGVLVESNRFFVNEAVLTGESVSLEKRAKDKIFMGTIVASGRGVMEVTQIGANTEVGKIATFVQEKKSLTPLEIQLRQFSKYLTALVIGLSLLVLTVGFLSGRPIEEILSTSVSLAVSSIPEGLLIALTVVLAIGMQRILARKGLVRQLVSAETLGSVTTICVDKTGTLTEGKLRVVDFDGSKDALITQTLVANDMDDPIVISAAEWAETLLGSTRELINDYQRIDTIPFSSEKRFFATLAKSKKATTLFVNGAPDTLLSWSNLAISTRKAIVNNIKEVTNKGFRVVGFASKKVSFKTNFISEDDVQHDLTWNGFIAFSDPIRPGVSASLNKALNAGLKLIVITGDFKETAKAVIKELGFSLKDKDVITGDLLDRLSEKELKSTLKKRDKIFLFARTSPEQKLRIVSVLKAMNEVVGMMGDGVNDAPALNRADIGIVVNEASDVSKETADLILLDSNFETVVAAIEEGRGIFDNMRKIILFLMCDAFGEITAVLGALLIGLPLPVTASQILWINIVSDGFPSLALTTDSASLNIMHEPPRKKDEPIVAKWMMQLIGTISLVSGVFSLILFIYYLNTTGDLILARSIAFASLGINSLVYVFSVRTLLTPIWKINPFKNAWLIISVFAGFTLQFLPFALPITREFLGLTQLSIEHIGLIFMSSLLVTTLVEVIKFIIRSSRY